MSERVNVPVTLLLSLLAVIISAVGAVYAYKAYALAEKTYAFAEKVEAMKIPSNVTWSSLPGTNRGLNGTGVDAVQIHNRSRATLRDVGVLVKADDKPAWRIDGSHIEIEVDGMWPIMDIPPCSLVTSRSPQDMTSVAGITYSIEGIHWIIDQSGTITQLGARGSSVEIHGVEYSRPRMLVSPQSNSFGDIWERTDAC